MSFLCLSIGQANWVYSNDDQRRVYRNCKLHDSHGNGFCIRTCAYYCFFVFQIVTLPISSNSVHQSKLCTIGQQVWQAKAPLMVNCHEWCVQVYTNPWVMCTGLYNLTKVRPLFTLSHRGPDNSPLLIVFNANVIILTNQLLPSCNWK